MSLLCLYRGLDQGTTKTSVCSGGFVATICDKKVDILQILFKLISLLASPIVSA